MRKVIRAFVGTALSLCLVGALAVASPNGPKAMGVGTFAVELARAMNLGSAGLTPEAAKKSLGDLGINIGRLDAPLTEGELVRILGQVGINVRSSSPGRDVTSAKAEVVLRTFRAELNRAAAGFGVFAEGNGGDDFNNGNGKGGKFKRKANLSPGVPPGQTD